MIHSKMSYTENSIHYTSTPLGLCTDDGSSSILGKSLLGMRQAIVKVRHLFSDRITSSNLENSIKFIDEFDITSAFSRDLWDLADNYPSANLPYRDLEGTYNNSNYHISQVEWTRFNNDLQISLLTLLDLVEAPEVKVQAGLSDICSQIINQLIEIQYRIQAFEGMNSLSSEMFSSLKLPIGLKNSLGTELRKIERKCLLEFLNHLSAVTLHKNETQNLINIVSKFFGYRPLDASFTSQKITTGLEKLRDYINLRSSRQRMNMQAGKTGVAEFIYQFCLNTLLGVDKNKVLMQMAGNTEKLIDIAAARNIGGYHFVFDLLTDRGCATLDSIGSKKTLGTTLTFEYDNLVLDESFYLSCKPVSFEAINVPIQKDNNCYLSAGWLKYCVFLHFFEQLNK